VFGTENTLPVDPGQTNPGPLIGPGVGGASLEICLYVDELVVVEHAGSEADNQMLPCPKLDAALTVTELVPAPEVIVTPLGIDQL